MPPYLSQKCQICCHQLYFFKFQMHQHVFGQGSTSDPAGELTSYNAPTDPLVSWGGGHLPLPSPFTSSFLRRFRGSVRSPLIPQLTFLATPMGPNLSSACGFIVSGSTRACHDTVRVKFTNKQQYCTFRDTRDEHCRHSTKVRHKT